MISIYCSEKLDGVAGAAIVMRHAVLSKLPAHFGGFLHPDSLYEELMEMSNERGKLIFVIDVCVDVDCLPLLEKVAEFNKLVYWNSSNFDCIVPPSKIFDKAVDKVCAAELAFNRFLPRDLIASQLSVLAREVKFWQVEDERARKLSDLIAAKYAPVELLDSLAKGVFWNSNFESFYQSYIVKKDLALNEVIKSLKIKSYLSFRFGYALVSSVLNSADACQHILDSHAGVDVAVIIYRDGHIVFRRRDGVNIDVKKLADLFKGGGHAYAAGARLNMVVKKDNFDEVLFYLDQSFKNFFVGA